MKVLIWAGLFTAAMTPLAAAAETTAECQLDDTRRAEQTSIQGVPAPAPGQPVAVPRETADAADAAAAPRPGTPRRRSGKRIPDAELIGPRGAL